MGAVCFKKTFCFSLEIENKLCDIDWNPVLEEYSFCKKELDSNGNLKYKGMRVRIGIDWGYAEKIQRSLKGIDYFGRIVNRCSRIEALAPGGVILTSSDFFNELKDPKYSSQLEEVGEFSWKSCGEKKLKGISMGCRVYCPYQRERIPPIASVKYVAPQAEMFTVDDENFSSRPTSPLVYMNKEVRSRQRSFSLLARHSSSVEQFCNLDNS